MKLVSWNLNGLRAAWRKGASTFFEFPDADIYAFQETRVNFPYDPAEIEGYIAYWSICKNRRGYSGTMCLTRHKPLCVTYDLGDTDFDTEGRIITMEFETFYFINSYTPNSQHAPDREDYRNQWDKLFMAYLTKLREKKPVIICGDFNVTVSEMDIYEENQRAERDDEGFLSTERESLHAILANGFVDSYRYVHPNEKGVYTWWSMRLFKRKENRGWRLDYFLVSEEIKEKIQESTTQSNVFGSDHCPIILYMNLQFGAPREKKPKQKWEKPTFHIYEKADKKVLSGFWDSTDWEFAEKRLRELQVGLTKSAYIRDREKMQEWQKRIVRSLEARMLAVRHVCSTASGPGVDGVKWVESHEKMTAALTLTASNYHSKPSRLFVVEGKNGKQRRIHVETYYDRAMQCLYSFALDPIAEAWGDRGSFAYRKGRSTFDLNEHLIRVMSTEDAPVWVFITDVCKCYENISHSWIMRGIPLAPYVLSEFLSAGYIFEGRLFPMTEGVGIGCSLSPIIANMTLDGLSDYVYSNLYPRGEIDYFDGYMLRYADDIIFTARTEETARKIQSLVVTFLNERGLRISHEKSKIVRVDKGFTFLSRTYYKVGNRLFARPSNQSMERFMTNMRDTIKNYVGSQQSLIETLNRKISGWASYHRTEEAEEAFKKMDAYITALLLELCEAKHPKWNRKKILEKYWYLDSQGRHLYALPKKKEIYVHPMSDTLLVNYDPVKVAVNPYINIEYLRHRANKREAKGVTGVYRTIWNRQEGKCHYCGHEMLRDEETKLIEAFPNKRNFTSRMAYVHTRCTLRSIDFVDTSVLPSSIEDVKELLQQLEGGTTPREKKFYRLDAYFRKCTKTNVLLTFEEIEEIMGEKLGVGSRDKRFWQRTGFMCISQCWLENGYAIKTLQPDDGVVLFARMPGAKTNVKVEIPDAIASGNLPVDAKYELENYFRYIIKKYGIFSQNNKD